MKAEELKELRKSHNLTQVQIAKAIGVTDSRVSEWENNVYKISNAYVLHLKNFFEKLESEKNKHF